MTGYHIALLGLPIVGAFQHYAICYGYKGQSKAEALYRAWYAFVGLGFLCVFIFALNP